MSNKKIESVNELASKSKQQISKKIIMSSKVSTKNDKVKKKALKSNVIIVDNLQDDNTKIKKNISPLRYPGGKTRACEKLNDVLIKYFKMNTIDSIVSPFFGGGSFEFYVQNTYNIPIVANDKFTPLYSFWLSAKNKNNELYSELCKKINITKDDFTKYRTEIMKLNKSPLDQAIYYFVINRCSFSGATLSGGFSKEANEKRFTQSSIEKVKKLDLSQFDISNSDFKEFLKNKFSKNRLIFLDPPYYLEKGSKLYGKNGDMHENFDHQGLFDVISKEKQWMITYNDCQFIRNLYKDFTIIDVNWSYGMNKSKKSSEIIILNN